MSEKYLIVGATGSIGSSLSKQLIDSNKEVHLVGRNEKETKHLSEKLEATYTVVNVLEDDFVEKCKYYLEHEEDLQNKIAELQTTS